MSLRMCRQRAKQGDIRLHGIQELGEALPRQANFHLPLASRSQMPSHPLLQVAAAEVEVVLEVEVPPEVEEAAAAEAAGKSISFPARS